MSPSPHPLAVVVLAAGKGTRMKSRRAKVLHELCGRPMLGHVLETASRVGGDRLIVVVGRDADEVRRTFEGRAEFVLQAEQKGTGHAVMQALPALEGHRGDVLVLYADTPLLREESLRAMRELRASANADLVMLTSPEPLPGVVVRDDRGRVQRIVELVDATPEERAIQEGNTGVYLMDVDLLRDGLAALDTDNTQGELYLTGVVAYAVAKGRRVEAIRLEDASECLGVNTRGELAEAAYALRSRKIDELLDAGVTIVDPEQTYVDVDVVVGRDTVIEPGCVIQGDTRIGEGVHVKPHCTIESSVLDDDVVIGPCAHLRPGTHLMKGVRIGNFVEVKNSVLGPGVKADHLSYVGDAEVGAGSSFGCGAITVNYDWDAKHRTVVGAGTRIGCNANLIAPVTLGDGAAVAAGSTVTLDVPDGALAVARTKQRNIEGWMARRARGARTDGAGTAPAATGSKAGAGRARSAAGAKRAAATKKESAGTKAAGRTTRSRKSSAKKSSAKKKSAKGRATPKRATKAAAKERPRAGKTAGKKVGARGAKARR
ncbi:MAG: bifunctional UDP-N-acetylglucosamine diphosphorylase/glucosamine-1-phosphate N-acetyltransferase GlmU [Myxococcota bacterium]